MEACETKLSFKANCFIFLTLYGNFHYWLCPANKKHEKLSLLSILTNERN